MHLHIARETASFTIETDGWRVEWTEMGRFVGAVNWLLYGFLITYTATPQRNSKNVSFKLQMKNIKRTLYTILWQLQRLLWLGPCKLTKDRVEISLKIAYKCSSQVTIHFKRISVHWIHCSNHLLATAMSGLVNYIYPGRKCWQVAIAIDENFNNIFALFNLRLKIMCVLALTAWASLEPWCHWDTQ